MPDFTIDYAQIKLIENIPLNNDDLKYIKEEGKAYKMSPVVPAFWTLVLLSSLFLLVQEDDDKSKNDDCLFYVIIIFSISIIT